jgi:hypothetical protein
MWKIRLFQVVERIARRHIPDSETSKTTWRSVKVGEEEAIDSGGFRELERRGAIWDRDADVST